MKLCVNLFWVAQKREKKESKKWYEEQGEEAHERRKKEQKRKKERKDSQKWRHLEQGDTINQVKNYGNSGQNNGGLGRKTRKKRILAY